MNPGKHKTPIYKLESFLTMKALLYPTDLDFATYHVHKISTTTFEFSFLDYSIIIAFLLQICCRRNVSKKL